MELETGGAFAHSRGIFEATQGHVGSGTPAWHFHPRPSQKPRRCVLNFRQIFSSLGTWSPGASVPRRASNGGAFRDVTSIFKGPQRSPSPSSPDVTGLGGAPSAAAFERGVEAELAVRTGTPWDRGRPHKKEKERQELTVLAVRTRSSERREEGRQRDQNRPPPGPQTSGLQEGGDSCSRSGRLWPPELGQSHPVLSPCVH